MHTAGCSVNGTQVTTDYGAEQEKRIKQLERALGRSHLQIEKALRRQTRDARKAVAIGCS